MNNEPAINYQPLVGDGQAWRTGLNQSYRKPLGWILLLGIVGTIVFFVKSSAVLPVVVGLIIYFFYVGYLVNKFKNQVWKEFALANNWQIDTTTNPNLLVPPSLQYGYSPGFSPIIQAQIANSACSLFTYNCTVDTGPSINADGSSDRNTRTDYYTVARVSLPATLPRILLLSKGAFGMTGNLRGIPNGQKLQLEGNFNDYFKLQMEAGQQIDVLSVLTPDVMQTLITYNHKEDIEIVGNSLYFILNGDQREPEDVRKLIESMLVLHKDILENINFPTHTPATA